MQLSINLPLSDYEKRTLICEKIKKCSLNKKNWCPICAENKKCLLIKSISKLSPF